MKDRREKRVGQKPLSAAGVKYRDRNRDVSAVWSTSLKRSSLREMAENQSKTETARIWMKLQPVVAH